MAGPVPSPKAQRRWRESAILAVLAIILLGQLWTSVRRLSITYDEADHLHAGYRYLECGDYGWNPEHPPLAKMVAALPLKFMSINDPIVGACGMPNSKRIDFDAGHDFVFANSERILDAARMAISVFALVLLVSVWFVARRMFGLGVAIVAALILAFEPNLLAHGALVTTDVPASAGIFVAVFASWNYFETRSKTRLLLAGIAAGVALSLKHSALLLAPILLLLAVADSLLAQRGSQRTQLTRNLGALVIVALLAAAVLWTAYGWHFAARRDGAIWTNAELRESESKLATQVIPAAKQSMVLPEAYLNGLQDVLISSELGRPFFLLGKVHPAARWYGFPVAIAIKSSLVLLLFLVIACGALKLWRDHVRELLVLTIPAAVYLLASLTSGLGNGIRHALPILPFAIIFAAAGVWSLASASIRWRAALVIAIALHIASSARAFPNYISYANELWGGPENTYAYLSDANAEWGQALKLTKDYVARTHPRNCWIVRSSWTRISDYGIPCGESSALQHDIPPVHYSGTLIVSSTVVNGVEGNAAGGVKATEIFRGRKPVAKLGGSAMLVYEGDFDLSPIAATQHFNRAKDMIGADLPRAIQETDLAIALAPDLAPPHALLCSVARSRGDLERAEQECNLALDLYRKDPGTSGAAVKSLARFMAQRGIRIRPVETAESSPGK